MNIDKPSGQTSFSVVALVKRLSRERRVGHAGTLDPMATGVLPVCLGQGTRVVEFLLATAKTYRAQIELGVATDTYDASGRVTRRGDASGVDREQLESALASFLGIIQQTPPMYSAVKYKGQRLYQLARAGVEVEPKSRPAQIYHLEIEDWQPPVVTIVVECGKGTYIRSLAHDLGQSLGCGANLKGLSRLSYGPFDLKNSISLSDLEDAFHYGYWQHFLHPIDSVLLPWQAMVVSNATEQVIKRGAPLTLEKGKHLPAGSSEVHCRTYTSDGYLLGVLRFNSRSRQWQPEKVFLS